MTSKFTELAIDCADPNGLARFWCSVLDYEVQDEDDGIVTIGSPMVPEGKDHLGPVPPTLTFAHVPEGKTVKNRLHLDVNPTDREQDEEVRRLLDLGARHADVGQTGDESWVCLDRRPHTAPDLLPVAYLRSLEHDEEPLQRWIIPTRARSNSANFLTHDTELNRLVAKLPSEPDEKLR